MLKQTIQSEAEYKPSEIVAAKFITNSNGNCNVHYVIDLIKADQLKARNYALNSKRPFYLIKGSEILRYLKTLE